MPIPKSAQRDLTPSMLNTLRITMRGILKFFTGYYAVDDPAVRVNVHTGSLDALYRRRLVGWGWVGNSTGRHFAIRLTEQGEELYYALDRAGQWDKSR